MWDLAGPGIELVSPALAGGFLTTVPPGKSPRKKFLKVHSSYLRLKESERSNRPKILKAHLLKNIWSCTNSRGFIFPIVIRINI